MPEVIESPAPPAPPPNPVPPVAPPATAFTTWDSPDGKLNPAFYDKLPDDVKYIGDTLKKYQTREELVRGFANLSTLAGKKGLLPLPDTAPPEAKADRKALLDGLNGVPKEAKAYALTRPAEVPENAWNPKLVTGFQDWAWKNSVSPASVRELTTLQTEVIKEQLAAQAEGERLFWDGQQKDFETQVRAKSIPSERANALAERGATALGFNLENPQHQLILKNAAVRMAMMTHAISVGEDSFVQGESDKGQGGDAMTLASDAVHNQANPLYKPLHDPSHPQHKEVKAKVEGWWKIAAAKKR